MDRAGRRQRGWLRSLCLWSALCGGAAGGAEIQFASSLVAARAAGESTKPVVVTFTAAWCGWCRKMATTTFPDPQVTAIADQYLWVKLDADEETALAARWRVHGLPHTLVLDAQDRVLGSQPGYMTPAALVQFLAESQANPQPLDGVPQAVLDGLADLQSAADAPAIVKQAVEQLSRAEPEGRALLLEALQDAQPGVRVHLAALLQDERLAVRATACGVLQRSVRGGPPFDPFAAADVRAEQARQWAELAAKSTTAP